jgi:hypothetical protein
MPRTISAATHLRVQELHAENPDALGPALGCAILDANIPVTAVAQLLTTTEATVYRWMHSSVTPSPVFHPGIKKIIAISRRAIRAGDAPLSGTHGQRMGAVSDLVIKHKTKPARVG